MSETDRSRRRVLAGIGLAGLAAGVGCEARAPAASRELRAWDHAADVVIAGSGAAAISAAIEARAAGAQVLVLERLPKAGGSSAMSGGVCYMGGGTPLQKALGFEDSVEAMHDFIAAAGGLHPRLDKIALYCEGSLEHFQWMVDQGVRYVEKFSPEKELPYDDSSLYYSGCELAHPWRDMARPAPRGHVPAVTGHTGGRAMMEALLASAQAAGVKMMTAVSCERLVRESDGRVAGIQFTDNGVTKSARARRAVVLACGGFIHNREMVRRYAPELYECSTPWANAGDLGIGIQMGMGAGAAAVRMHQGFTILPVYPPERVIKGIVVNARAQRFIAEDSYYACIGHEVAFAQQGKAFLVTDADCSYDPGDFRMPLLAEAAGIGELEGKGGFAPGTLTHAVATYNSGAARGEDPLLHKHPKFLAPLVKAPFRLYELDVTRAFCCSHTFGGLETTLDSQVLDVFGSVIPGLYAAGRTTAGLPTSPYIASGISVGDCTFFGRRAGRHAAKEVT
jgi:succinate dehydrogenase/fumarate reductase flavoprotein subunit